MTRKKPSSPTSKQSEPEEPDIDDLNEANDPDDPFMNGDRPFSPSQESQTSSSTESESQNSMSTSSTSSSTTMSPEPTNEDTATTDQQDATTAPDGRVTSSSLNPTNGTVFPKPLSQQQARVIAGLMKSGGVGNGVGGMTLMGGGGLEQETVLVFPWKKTKHLLHSMGVKAAHHRHQHKNGHKGGEKLAGSVQSHVGADQPEAPEPDQKDSKASAVATKNENKNRDIKDQQAKEPDTEPHKPSTSKKSFFGKSSQKTTSSKDKTKQQTISKTVQDDDDAVDINDEVSEEGPVSPNSSSPSKKSHSKKSSSRHSHHQSHVLPITIPHGFQTIRNLTAPKPSLKSVLYISSTPTQSDAFWMQDAHHLHVTRNGVKVQSLSTLAETSRHAPATPSGGSTSGAGVVGARGSAVGGLSRWVYVKKWRVAIIATSHLELKIMTPSSEILATTSSVKPVLSLEFNEEREELIAGGIENIRVSTARYGEHWIFAKHYN
jgi:hypothetical protein